MAVFTPLDAAEVDSWLDRFDLGTRTDLQGIASGIENTNYFLSTTQGRFVLTLFERLQAEQLPFYLGLMHHLAAHGIPVPDPMPDRQGQTLHTLKGKPAALVTRLQGRSQLQPEPVHCAQVGHWLARMHLAARDYAGTQPNLRGLAWQTRTIPDILPYLTADQRTLISTELAHQTEVAASPAYAALPRSAVHADLFRDNVLFEGDTLSGVFDFYFAGVDTWLFDLAVALNDWCIHLQTGEFDAVRFDALLNAYLAVRSMSDAEHRLLPDALRAAALRFWTSRLADYHLPRDAHLLTPHDPIHFERVLRQRIASA
ncbi:Homoserine kinase [Thiomonas arsenitoxydans]|uniref:Homoserine kinase n=1 Tax=Thiomonas arsenitoxydans (strain DSM 22701 / CIP 110005 / 3As) TaxID=426114 RepID=D6CQG9_THIA3|nr:homoserine kinase [Thiomonas arsenitoxydans]CAZ88249.1 putative Homoserine kinase ThrB [Thiomonas arsenitoxydans]CQR32870.1 Homoserine kinase [Thiomonas arsenitoxydans]CQR33143.1 Homoserine kinase [Thiomonas arsenitoxydans]CQR33801.1 Homoserine kinase [Thiomonas arsenitoxydans]CQR40170.1 Homoserine kinase [Thiomonas arsenitoxydans]